MEHDAAGSLAQPLHFIQDFSLPHRRPASNMGVESLCESCRQHELCLPASVVESGCLPHGNVLIGRRRLRKGQDLFRQGDRFDYVYAVRAGTFKTRFGLRDGREHVTGFALAGDLLGLDAVQTGMHGCSATALEDADVCSFPYEAFIAAPESASALHERITQFMAAELARGRSLLMLVAHANSDARVAAFLLQMSHRLAERGFSPDEFQLRMSRADIGSYLGLTLETVSRTMSALDARGWVRVHKKRLRLLRRDSLAQLCDEVLPGCDPLFACGAPPAAIAA